MADKSFGIRQLNLIGGSGTANITSPNNLNLNASTVAISTDVTIGRHLDVDGHTELDALNVSGVSTSVQVRIGSNTIAASTAGDDLVIEGSSDRGLSIISGNASSSNIYFGDSDDTDVGRIAYQHNDNALDFSTNAGSTSIRIDSLGRLGIATASPGQRLHVIGQSLFNNGSDTTSDFYINPSSTATILDAKSGTLRFDMNGIEKFRIASNGEIGLVGANYGTSGQVLTSQGSGSAPQWASGGKILQVVTTDYTGTFSTSTPNTFQQITGLNRSITLSSSSSRVLILLTIGQASTANGASGSFAATRDGTRILLGAAAGTRGQTSIKFYMGSSSHSYGFSFIGVDSPGASGSYTYGVQASAQAGTTLYVNRTQINSDLTDSYEHRAASHLTLLEIA